MGVSGSQNRGALRTSDVTGRLRTSGRARIVRAAWISRSRWLPASHISPSGWLSRAIATSLGMQYRSDWVRALVVNSGGSPVSRVGWPKTSPRVIRATTASLCTSSSVPSRTR